MIKDVFVLRKNSWHMKLMKWIWNLDHRDFTHICPYFWMSVLNLIIVAPLAIIRALLWCIKTPLSAMEARIEAKNQADFDKWINELRSDPEKTIREAAMMCNKDWEKYEYALLYGRVGSPSVNPWLDKFSNEYWNKIDDARAEYKANKRQEEYEAEVKYAKAANARKAKINKIISYVKPVAMGLLWIVMSGLAILALWGIYYVGVAIVHMKAKYWIIVGELFLIIAGVALGLVVLYQVMKWILERAVCSNGVSKWVKAIELPFKWLFTGLATIWDIVSTMVANSCPYIDWKEDN